MLCETACPCRQCMLQAGEPCVGNVHRTEQVTEAFVQKLRRLLCAHISVLSYRK